MDKHNKDLPAFEKGKALEDLVEQWALMNGFKVRRNVRLRGRSGALHEIDVLLESNNKLIVVEVKNMSSKVPKEVIMKVFNVTEDIGGSGAIVVSSSGFTDSALKLAKSLKVELYTLDDILNYIEIVKSPRDALFLELNIEKENIINYINSKFIEKILFIFKKEYISLVECKYIPIYILDIRIIEKGKITRYKDTSIAVEALSGLPLYVENTTIKAMDNVITIIPPDLIKFYKIIRNKKVSRQDVIDIMGESKWRRFYSLLRDLGLIEVLSKRPLILYIKDVIPSIKHLEEASSLFLVRAKRAPDNRCKDLLEPRVSPGGTIGFIESLINGNVIRTATLYAPIYMAKLLNKRNNYYRFIYLSGWLHKPYLLNLNYELQT
ncbi:MAG: restriction endonuclease [Desulfurococcales archaeon]|nr:restriction endonuclease [Desulfurococcales archaeon]